MKKFADSTRDFIHEWSLNILILLFGTTTLVQAFIVPTGSMESTVLIGDHLLVDKLSYAPADPISKYLLPYTEPKRGDVIVFRYPMDIRQNFVKRVIGVPGDHIHIVDKVVYVNGKALTEPYAQHIDPHIEPYRDNFPSQPYGPWSIAPSRCWRERSERRTGGARRELFRHGRQSREFARQPLLGFRAARKHHRQAAGDLLVL